MASWEEITHDDVTYFPISELPTGGHRCGLWVPEPHKAALLALLDDPEQGEASDRLRLMLDLFDAGEEVYATKATGPFQPTQRLHDRVRALAAAGKPAPEIGDGFVVSYNVGHWPDWSETFHDGVQLQGGKHAQEVRDVLQPDHDEVIIGYEHQGMLQELLRGFSGPVLTTKRFVHIDGGEAQSFAWSEVTAFERHGLLHGARINNGQITFKAPPLMERFLAHMVDYSRITFAAALRERGFNAELGQIVVFLA